MNVRVLFLISFCILVLSACSTAKKAESYHLCPKVIVHSNVVFELTETEKRMICGDQEVSAYANIPSYQASFMMTSFLQSRGYSVPRFEYEKDLLHVYPGEMSFLKSVVAVSSDSAVSKEIESDIFRLHRKKLITPKLLNQIESDALKNLRNTSYACAKVESTVDASEGVVTLKIRQLDSYNFGDIEKEDIPGVNPKALVRFYPFFNTDPFKAEELQLAEKRFIREGVVQATYFQEKCDNEKKEFKIYQQFIPGLSRTIRFGVGANTEVGPMVRAKWANQRSGEMASLLEANLQAAFKYQSFSFISERYMWENKPRRSLLMTFSIEHNDMLNFEEINIQLKPHMKWTRDGHSRFWLWSLGPSFLGNIYVTDENAEDTRKVESIALEGRLHSKSHIYEFFDLHPEEGNYFDFNFSYRHPGLGFDNELLKLDFSYLTLKRFGDWGKGSAIGGIKTILATTWVDNLNNLSDLPPSVKYYGGGSEDIRGFKIGTLSGLRGEGALSKFVVKMELRKTHLFINTLESFSFVDTGWLSEESFKLDSQYWTSPGTGLRWMSPIGMVQSYVALPFSNKDNYKDDLFFYLGLGGTF